MNLVVSVCWDSDIVNNILDLRFLLYCYNKDLVYDSLYLNLCLTYNLVC